MAGMPEVVGVFERWQATGEMTPAMAEVVEAQLEPFMDFEFDNVDRLAQSDPYVAYAFMLQSQAFLNSALSVRPSIMSKLSGQVSKLSAKLKALGKKLAAATFSIGVGLPVGVSIRLSFPV